MKKQQPKSKPESAEQPSGEGLQSTVLLAVAAALKKRASKIGELPWREAHPNYSQRIQLREEILNDIAGALFDAANVKSAGIDTSEKTL